MNISLLDCTLRDGAHVNKGLFGISTIRNIINALDNAKLDIIEAGFLRNVTYQDGSTIFNEIDDFEYLINHKTNSNISLMIRPDQYNINKLYKKSDLIDRLRFAFYKKDIDITKDFIYKANNLGYKISLNPINIGMYSYVEIEDILKNIIDLPIDSISIVDTFGMFKKESFRAICNIFSMHLPKSISLGIHLHENLSLSFGLICDYLEFGDKRKDIIIDSALFGMGRIPGNLPTEIIAQHLIEQYNKPYELEYILQIISQEIEPIKLNLPWGYSPVYLLTATKCIHRDYGEYLHNMKVPYNLCVEILDEIKKKGKSLIYDKQFIENLLKKGNI